MKLANLSRIKHLFSTSRTMGMNTNILEGACAALELVFFEDPAVKLNAADDSTRIDVENQIGRSRAK
jgi:hypothetical protein